MLRRTAILLLVLLLASVAGAQAAPRFRLLHVKVRGTTSYSEAEILKASGLKLGAEVTQDDLQEATNKLGNSGAFSTVNYQFAGAPGGVNVIFDLRENPQLASIIFENLVWAPDAQLLQALQERVPLFHGKVPLAGDMMDQARGVLEQVLAERGVKATVSSHFAGAGTGAASVAYEATSARVRIASIDFTGREQLDAGALSVAVQNQRGELFRRSSTIPICAGAIRTTYQARGYLAITVDDPQVTVVDPSPTQPAVALTFPLHEGRQYRFSGLAFAGNQAVTSEELQRFVTLRPGDIANQPRLAQELLGARKIYGTRGYLLAQFTPQSVLHEDEGIADFVVVVKEGQQYRMGVLNLRGFAPDLEARARSLWRIAQGEPFDESYPMRFVVESLQKLVGYHRAPLMTQRIDDALGTVDVTIDYKPQ